MYIGKTLFAQIMDFIPWTSFGRIVARYHGNARLRTLPCTEQFSRDGFCANNLARKSSRHRSLSAQSAKLYHIGLRKAVARSTLADANESRDWRIWADFAQVLIRKARNLYAAEPLELELADTVYALDSTTIDLCLSVFPWAHFRSTKAAVKMHTLER
jgi:Domain of unknown function (DUF4372)